MISFNYETDFLLENESEYERWIQQIIIAENKQEGEINYVFCDDEYLLDINQKYLNHDYYTDIISFDYSVANDYHLTNATLLGTDGTEIGIFGLGFPFNKRGYSFLMPYIEKMEILNTAIPVNGTLKVDITAKSN